MTNRVVWRRGSKADEPSQSQDAPVQLVLEGFPCGETGDLLLDRYIGSGYILERANRSHPIAALAPQAPPPDLIRGNADLLVLSVLSDGPLYGYAIIKQVAGRTGGAVRLTPGVLYPLLHQMENHGLLLSSWETVRAQGTRRGRGRKRKWYRLSAKGRRRLAQRVAAHRAYQAIIDSILPDAEAKGAGG